MSENKGKMLKLWRRSLGMSQQEMGDKANLTQRCISNYESGKTDFDLSFFCLKLGINSEDEFWHGPQAGKLRFDETYGDYAEQISPRRMIPLYCLSDIGNPELALNPIVGFCLPDLAIDNPIQYAAIRIDKKIARFGFGARIILRKTEIDGSVSLVWDDKRGAMFVDSEPGKNQRFMGSVVK
jgi:transcriptional regulator with XRE-family HTH domain